MKGSVLVVSLLFIYPLLFGPSEVSGQSHVTERLISSPRHHEWVQVKSEGRDVHSFVAYPELEEKALAVVVIHENRGLSDWVRGVADQLAEAGYIAIAPDLLSGKAPEGGNTSDFANSDEARKAIYELNEEHVSADLKAVADYIRTVPAANGKVAVAGFCWGGSQTFTAATTMQDIEAAFVFYGRGPLEAGPIERIEAPVYAFYGGSDARVNATIPDTKTLMEAAGKLYEYEIYEGAGHGFMRSGEDPTGSAENQKARQESWARWLSILDQFD